LIGVCEKNAAFSHLFEECQYIDRVVQVSAGKYRRYAGLKWYQRWFDLKTLMLNIRDVGRTISGYKEAKRLLKELNPNVLLIKGGFVAVPIGKAAAKLGIPYVTHDSDSTPGLANRLISSNAKIHATGMPVDLYNYPKDKTIYTGIPVSEAFKKVSPGLKSTYREDLGLSGCEKVITIVGGSQGAGQLNLDMVSIAGRLMQKYPNLGIVHVAGKAHESKVRKLYNKELLADEARRVVVQGFVGTIDASQGAADVVISRAGATQVAELSLQALPVILVPGLLAGAHQEKNADYLEKQAAALKVSNGNPEALYSAVDTLLSDDSLAKKLSEGLSHLAKPQAARELAIVTMSAL